MLCDVFIVLLMVNNLFVYLQKNSEICTYSYPDTILSVKLNRQVISNIIHVSTYIQALLPSLSPSLPSLSPSSYLSLPASLPCLQLHSHTQRLVVVLRQNLYIHNIRDMKVSYSALSPCTHNTYSCRYTCISRLSPVILLFKHNAYT